jgi:hypothetical protein
MVKLLVMDLKCLLNSIRFLSFRKYGCIQMHYFLACVLHKRKRSNQDWLTWCFYRIPSRFAKCDTVKVQYVDSNKIRLRILYRLFTVHWGLHDVRSSDWKVITHLGKFTNKPRTKTKLFLITIRPSLSCSCLTYN